MGTTILALKYRGGVVMCADAKTSTGPLAQNRFARKLTQISEKVFMARCGNAADTQFVAQLIKHHLEQHRIELSSNGMDVQQVTVKSAASLCRLIAYNNRDNISGSFIMAGVDKLKGAQIYRVAGGAVFEDVAVAAGSGSTYILGLIDSTYKKDMSRAECLELAQRLVVHATLRDGSSGGMIRWLTIDESEGVTEGCITGDQMTKMETIIAQRY